jgi:hypothetical protein
MRLRARPFLVGRVTVSASMIPTSLYVAQQGSPDRIEASAQPFSVNSSVVSRSECRRAKAWDRNFLKISTRQPRNVAFCFVMKSP